MPEIVRYSLDKFGIVLGQNVLGFRSWRKRYLNSFGGYVMRHEFGQWLEIGRSEGRARRGIGLRAFALSDQRKLVR